MNIVIDIETQGLKINDKINFVGFYAVINGQEKFKIYSLPEDLIEMQIFIELQNRRGAKWCGHNLKFDAVRLLYQHGIDITISNDTMILAYLTSTVDELKDHRGKWLSLKDAAPRILGVEDWDIGSHKMSRDIDKVREYLYLDCKYTYELLMYFKEELSKNKIKTYKLIINALNAYKYIEINGLPIDLDKLYEVYNDYLDRQREVDKELQIYGNINYNSTKQLADLLFNTLELPVLSYTKTGKPALGVDSLNDMVDKHPIIPLLLKKRSIEKGLSFLKAWSEEAIERDGIHYLHSNFNLHGTVTGRTSSSNVNLQQVPRDKNLKSIFRSVDPEWEMVQFDFSQLELRFAALVADIRNMKNAYREGRDLHTEMAMRITGKPADQISKADRTGAKAANFGYLYGMQAFSFVEYAKSTYGIHITLDEAMMIRQAYFDMYPELELYYAKVNSDMMNYSKQTSIMGREYHLNTQKLINPYKRADYLRAAINFPVQSPASDYVLSGIVELILDHPELKERVKVGATVHDSAITLIKKDDKFYDTIEIIRNIMEKSIIAKQLIQVDIDIPIVVDSEIGPWGLGVSVEDYKI